MKRRMFELVIIGTLSLMSLPRVVNARSVVPEKEDSVGASGKTGVTVDVKKSTDPLTPVQPDDPNTAVKDAKNNGVKAPSSQLSLVYVTNSIKFKSLTTNQLGKQADSVSVDSSNSNLWDGKFVVEIADARGTLGGWHLMVTGDGLKQVQDKPGSVDSVAPDSVAMDSATIELPKGTVKRSGKDEDNTSDIINSGDVSIQLNDSNGTEILSSKSNGGGGTTTCMMDPDRIKLSVPVNDLRTGNYATTLNWTLYDGPVQ